MKIPSDNALMEIGVRVLGKNRKVKVRCKLCGKRTPAATAHRHGKGWVGECCWDERLRATE